MKTQILFLLSVILSVSLSAQTFVQKGIVVDDTNEPLVGVSVNIKGTKDGTMTDADGKFSIPVKNGSTLVFNYIGFITQEYKTDSTKTDIKIALDADARTLDEVVVSGYATVRKADLVGASYSVSGISASYPDAVLDESQVGLMTAGEINDFSKWAMWDSIATKTFSRYLEEFKIAPLERYVAQLTNPGGLPIVNATVILADEKNNALWQAKTDNTGKAELWANMMLPASGDKAATIYVEYGGMDTTVVAKPFSKGINNVQLPVSCNTTKDVDIMMIVDATGSMGDEITYLQNELHDILNKIKKTQSGLNVRVGSVFYRDRGDEYVTRKTSLDKDIKKTINFIKGQRASGGGDYPEALDEALYQSIELEEWGENALTRLAFVVLDAPAHNDAASVKKIQEQVKLAAEKGVRIIPLACSDIQKDGEYLMRSMALATNGTYVFLTDDSGIGNSHLKPTTDKYDVELLNDLIIRLVNQYTQMPDCNNDKWVKDYKKEQPADKFVPSPYDEDPDESDRLKDKNVIKVYPNPCDDILKVDIKKGG
ncbi:MAG: carboxypeptidase-like regulatory domain-containing protein [Dysgonomonas sp.]